jgi:hypothetical protein
MKTLYKGVGRGVCSSIITKYTWLTCLIQTDFQFYALCIYRVIKKEFCDFITYCIDKFETCNHDIRIGLSKMS